MHNKYILLVIGSVLVLVGLLKPNLDWVSIKPSNVPAATEVNKPSDPNLLKLAQDLVSCVKDGKVTREDSLKLAGLCFDMSTLISLDGSSEVIKSTEEIRQANKLSGMMLRIDMNKKYPDLASKMQALVVGYIGDDIVVLNSDLRSKSSDAFKALAWAFIEGTR